MKKNTILIMGGNGFLGSYLYDHLQKIKKYKLFKQSRKSFADVTFNPNNKKELFKNLETIKPNIIINLISCTELDKCEANVEYTIKPMRPPSIAELNKNGPQRATEADFEHQGISPDGTWPYRPPEERAPTTATSTETTAGGLIEEPIEQAPISAAAQRQNALNQSRANDAAGISNITNEPENP